MLREIFYVTGETTQYHPAILAAKLALTVSVGSFL